MFGQEAKMPFLLLLLAFMRTEKVLQTNPPISSAIRFFHTLLAQHVSTLQP
jgi:hypothetical protein